jgi:hypothetical protein
MPIKGTRSNAMFFLTMNMYARDIFFIHSWYEEGAPSNLTNDSNRKTTQTNTLKEIVG